MGANGSGKSSVMRTIVGNAPFYRNDIWYHTVSEERRLVAVGKYDNACGGCDGIKQVQNVYILADRLSREYPDYDLYFEGIRMNSIFHNVVKLLLELKYVHGREPEVHLLYTNPRVSVERVLGRNGGKEIVQDAIVGAVKTALRNFRHHRELGLYRCFAHDSTLLTPEQIAEEILNGHRI